MRMNKTWVVPAVVCLLLLAAWPFRWEKGPLQEYANITTVQYIRDRWTGDNWLHIYAHGNVEIRPTKGSEGWLINIPKPGVLAQKKLLEKRQTESWEEYWKAYKLAKLEAEGYIRLLTAYGRRNLATGIWVLLVFISGLWSWRLYCRQEKQSCQLE